MMITKEQIKQGEEFFNILISKSWENQNFKNELIENPENSIGEVFGTDVLEMVKDYKFIVEDQTDTNIIYLNIPRKIDVDDFELTDEQLEAVSGGDFVSGLIIAGCVIGGVAVVAVVAGVAIGYYLNKK